jgi:1-acyl-sn-glycerol-3-phosphate acyltransferase
MESSTARTVPSGLGRLIWAIRNRVIGGTDPTHNRPEAAARARRRQPSEGLAWLGRPPSPRAGPGFRLIWTLGRFLVFRVFGVRAVIQGREHIPAQGGQIIAAAVHRGWIDPLLLLEAFPLQPRLWFIGSGPSLLDRPWKEWILLRVGGYLPSWRGGASMDAHLASGRAVLDGGGRVAMYIEGQVAGPEHAIARARSGAAFLSLRTGAPIVPVAVIGTRDLYRGKHVASRVLPPVTVRELLGDDWPGTDPVPDSREELRVVRLATDRLVARLNAALADILPLAADEPGARRRWAWIGRIFG